MGASGMGDACWWSGPGMFGESNTCWLDNAPMQVVLPTAFLRTNS